jgi:ribosomal protein S3AE
MAKNKKLVKKEFFEVKAPITSTKISLFAANPQELEGKVISLDLTRSLRGKSLQLKLKVINENGSLTAEPVSLELMGSYIRRVIRNRIDYVEDSFIAECKDASVLIKPFMITRNQVSRAIRNEIRNLTKKHLQVHLKTRTFKEIFSEIMSNKIQKDLSLKTKKVYPLALCEIKAFKVLKPQKNLRDVDQVKEIEQPQQIQEQINEEQPKKEESKKKSKKTIEISQDKSQEKSE